MNAKTFLAKIDRVHVPLTEEYLQKIIATYTKHDLPADVLYVVMLTTAINHLAARTDLNCITEICGMTISIAEMGVAGRG